MCSSIKYCLACVQIKFFEMNPFNFADCLHDLDSVPHPAVFCCVYDVAGLAFCLHCLNRICWKTARKASIVVAKVSCYVRFTCQYLLLYLNWYGIRQHEQSEIHSASQDSLFTSPVPEYGNYHFQWCYFHGSSIRVRMGEVYFSKVYFSCSPQEAWETELWPPASKYCNP